jgi:hypothetical protein
MKKSLLVLVLLLTTGTVAAGSCGAGKITVITEGSHDHDAFVIAVDYSRLASDHPNTSWQDVPNLIAYKPSEMSKRRFEGIKRIALTALVHNKNVYTWTHSGRCDDAGDLSIVSY